MHGTIIQMVRINYSSYYNSITYATLQKKCNILKNYIKLLAIPNKAKSLRYLQLQTVKISF